MKKQPELPLLSVAASQTVSAGCWAGSAGLDVSDAYTFCWHFIWQWFNTSFLILLFSTGCIPKWEGKDGKMMQNMRQVGEIFLCYGSIHKQPPLTAAGKCRINRFKTRKGGTQSLCRDQCTQFSWDKNVLSDCKWCSAQNRRCRGPMITHNIAVVMHV